MSFPDPPREFRRLGNSTGRLDDAKLRQGLESIGFACGEEERAEIVRKSSTYGNVEVEKLLDLCRVSDCFELCVHYRYRTHQDTVSCRYRLL